MLATQGWNPGGGNGVYNDAPFGVWYYSSPALWSVFNQDINDIPEGASFNLMIPPASFDITLQTATSSNITTYYTTVDHALLNGDPDALFIVTQNWNPGGGSGVYNDSEIGLWYSSSTSRWNIYNHTIGDMPDGANFNVFVPL